MRNIMDNQRLYVFAPKTDDLFEALLSALERNGYRLVRLESIKKEDAGFCLVYITSELIDMLGGEDAANTCFAQSDFVFIPIINEKNNQGQKKILSQYFYTVLDISNIKKYAQRIYLLTSVGEKQWKDWNYIHSLAVDWKNAGQPKHRLLSQRDYSLASKLLKQPIHELMAEQAEVVREICIAVERYLNHKKRIRQTAIVLIGAVFIVIGMFAVISKINAGTAASRSRQETAGATSDWLAAKAREVMNSDPDLPWLLMDAALSVSKTQESMMTAHEVTENLIAHRSIPLSAPASSLGYLGNSVYIVGFMDGSGFSIIDAASGDILYCDSASGGNTCSFIAVSPDMRYFAVRNTMDADAPGEVKFYCWTDGSVKFLSVTKQPVDSFGFWKGDGCIVALMDGCICEINIFTGKEEVCEFAGLSGTPIDIAVDEKTDNMFVALYDEKMPQIAVYSLSKQELLDTVPVAGYGQMHYDPVNQTLLVDTGTSAVLIDMEAINRREEVETDKVELAFARTKSVLASDLNGSFYLGSSTGAVYVLKPCNAVPVSLVQGENTSASYWSYASGFTDNPQCALIAHRAQVTGITMAEQGKWATVGTDRMLRIWDETIYGRVNAMLEVGDTNYQARTVGRENAIRVSMGSINDSTAVVMTADGFSRLRFDRKTLAAERYDYGRFFAHARTAYQTGDMVEIYGLDRCKVTILPAFMKPEESRILSDTASAHWFNALFEASSDGNTVYGLLPDGDQRGSCAIWRRNGESEVRQLNTAANMLYLEAIDNKDALAINTKGEVLWFGGEQKMLFAEPTALTAATRLSGNCFLSLDIEGNLWRNKDFLDARIIGYFAPSNGGFLIRTSASGRLAAVVGKSETRVFNTETGEVLAVLHNLFASFGEAGSASVHDVLFDPDDKGMVVAYSNGWIDRFDFMEQEDVLSFLHQNCPRQFSDEELFYYGI